MENVRLRRLKADYEALRRLVRLHPRIALEGVSGNPPERYRLILRVDSLRERGEVVERAAEHRLEVTLPLGYPRDAPLFRMLSPVFHPNIAPHAVCIGDHWSAAEPLDALIQRVGEMLAFQSYNTKSPLNGAAAAWVELHKDQLPIDAAEFFVDLAATESAAPDAASARCQNCDGQTANMFACASTTTRHILCNDCAMGCPTCARIVCLACNERSCPACYPACGNCGAKSIKESRFAHCAAGHALCGDCAMTCGSCARVTCLACGERACPACPPPDSPYGRPVSAGIT